MKNNYFLLLAYLWIGLLACPQELSAVNYFVAPCDLDNRDGLSEASAFCTIQAAADIAQPGDTIFIQSGTYLDEQVLMKKSGTANNPIVFIGYQTSVGDLPLGIPMDYFKKDGSFVHEETVLPWLKGNNHTGTAITLSAYDYIEIKNLQISGYRNGIEGSSQYSNNVNIQHIYGTDFTNSGIEFYGSDYLIEHCIIADASVHAFVSFGSNNRMSNCEAYAINKKISTYFSLRRFSSFGNDGILENCWAEQVGDFAGATGFNIYEVSNSQIIDCTSKYISQNFRVHDIDVGFPANSNVFTNCLAVGENGFLIQNNSNSNQFVNCKTEKSLSVFFAPGSGTTAGKDNFFLNCIFWESPSVIKITGHDNQVEGNHFINCTIDGNNIINGLFDSQATSHNNHIINSVITGIKDFKSVTATHDPGFAFESSLFHTIKRDSFLPDAYKNNSLFFEDPLFFDCIGDTHLQANSPCIDAGIDYSSISNLSKDYWGVDRPQGNSFDIGASEFDASYQPNDCATQVNYYVCACTNGQGSGDGLSEATAFCSISEAALLARAGDTVFIKAGTYYERVRPGISGKEGKPIVYEGYQNMPGDNPTLNYHYGDDLDPTKLPVLDGIDTTGVGFDLEYMSHVTIRNMTLTRFQDGFYSANASYYLTLDNVGTFSIGGTDCGDFTGTDICNEGCGDANLLTGGYNTIKNSFATNAGAHNYYLFGDHNILENCRSYGDEDYPNPTGYYIILSGSYNLIKDCEIERIGEPCHSGHGIGISDYGHSNQFVNCTSTNTNKGFYVRGPAVHSNQFVNCISFDDIGYVVRDSAHHNQFLNCSSKNDLLGVRFYDSSTFGDNGNAGNNNIFYNCLFESTTGHMVEFLASSYPDNPAENNAFVNCVFDAKENPTCELFQTTAINSNTLFINSIFKGLSDFDNIESTKEIDVSFYNCLFWDNTDNSTFVPLNHTNENPIYADPQFVSDSDYHLQSTSPAIDKGTIPNLFDLGFNFNYGKDGNGRPLGAGQEIGLYEYPTTACVSFYHFFFDHEQDSIYQVADSIYSQNRIANGRQITYQAGQSIQLLPGFSVDANSTFLAKIETTDCSDNSLTSPPSTFPQNKSIVLTNTKLKIAPNPFQQETNLSFYLDIPAEVSLNVSTLTGKIVKVFEKDTIKKDGWHTYQLRKNDLENGFYIVYFKMDDEVYARKIILNESTY